MLEAIMRLSGKSCLVCYSNLERCFPLLLLLLLPLTLQRIVEYVFWFNHDWFLSLVQPKYSLPIPVCFVLKDIAALSIGCGMYLVSDNSNSLRYFAEIYFILLLALFAAHIAFHAFRQWNVAEILRIIGATGICLESLAMLSVDFKASICCLFFGLWHFYLVWMTRGMMNEKHEPIYEVVAR
ncbi:hypothetical protein ACOME3_000657 [Neoechinorhynchus agilis]